MNLKTIIKDQLTILLIEIIIFIISAIVLNYTVYRMSFLGNIYSITLDCLVFPGTYLYWYINFITENKILILFGSIIGNHLIYSLYFYLAKKYRIIFWLIISIYILWLLFYIYLKISF